MIATEELIKGLAAQAPRRPGSGSIRLAAGIGMGALLAFVALALLLGWPLASVPYTGVPAFTMKLAFAIAMTAAGALLLFAAGRPGRQVHNRLAWLLVPPVLVAGAAVVELAITAPQFRSELWFGSTWATCLLAIVGFSLPVLGGITWAFKRLAPTNLELAGFLAGITSGSAAAVAYAFYCPETTATFLLSWYTAGILLAGVIGSLAGPRLLRW